MNKIIVLATLTIAAMASQAQDLGRVLSATPLTQQVAVPQQVCGNATISNGARPTTGGGAVLGAIAGGAAGNAVGLSEQDAVRLLFDDTGPDIGKRRKLGREVQTRRAAADDQYVDLRRQIAGRP